MYTNAIEVGVDIRTVSLMYHDVIERAEFKRSGFTGVGADRYKIDLAVFSKHLAALEEAGLKTGSPEIQTGNSPTRCPCFHITFDDGGACSLCAADSLERHGFQGYFFVPTDYIGKPRFLAIRDVVELVARGHIVGSHSKSHPEKMSQLGADDIFREWLESIDRLNEIVGQSTTTASIPNGRYSRTVANCAAKAGIQHLFTSEPRVNCQRFGQCVVSGRYTILGNTPSKNVVALALGTSLARSRQVASWNARKCLKFAGGAIYEKARSYLLRPNSVEPQLEGEA
jgi:peptidoglycan/xylan/chitin deacetylase (PgdA/CDA1 family)